MLPTNERKAALVDLVKRLHKDLGRTPKLAEIGAALDPTFKSPKNKASAELQQTFASMNALCEAAGVEPYRRSTPVPILEEIQ